VAQAIPIKKTESVHLQYIVCTYSFPVSLWKTTLVFIMARDGCQLFAQAERFLYTIRMQLLTADTLIGHGRIRDFLAQSWAAKRHHAFLFCGTEHVGKDTVARAFVGTVFGREIAEWAALATHPDFAFLTRDEQMKNIGVEEMRTFLAHFTTSSLLGGVKVGVIPDAEALSIEAANALLKTLEEPKGNALLILMTKDVSRTPATVASRCQVLRFLPVPTRELVVGLLARGVSQIDAERLAAIATGKPGIAITMVNDPAARETYETTVERFRALLVAPIARRISAAGEVVKDATPVQVTQTLDVWTAVLRDMMCAQPLARTVGAIRATRAAQRMLGENVNARLAVEHAILAL